MKVHEGMFPVWELCIPGQMLWVMAVVLPSLWRALLLDRCDWSTLSLTPKMLLEALFLLFPCTDQGCSSQNPLQKLPFKTTWNLSEAFVRSQSEDSGVLPSSSEVYPTKHVCRYYQSRTARGTVLKRRGNINNLVEQTAVLLPTEKSPTLPYMNKNLPSLPSLEIFLERSLLCHCLNCSFF